MIKLTCPCYSYLFICAHFRTSSPIFIFFSFYGYINFFPFSLSFLFSCLGTKGLWDRSPTAWFLIFSLSLTFPSWPWRYGIESAQPQFIFLFSSLDQPRGRMFDSHTPQPLFSYNFLCLTKRFWARIPLLSFLFSNINFPIKVKVRIPLTTFV